MLLGDGRVQLRILEVSRHLHWGLSGWLNLIRHPHEVLDLAVGHQGREHHRLLLALACAGRWNGGVLRSRGLNDGSVRFLGHDEMLVMCMQLHRRRDVVVGLDDDLLSDGGVLLTVAAPTSTFDRTITTREEEQSSGMAQSTQLNQNNSQSNKESGPVEIVDTIEDE